MLKINRDQIAVFRELAIRSLGERISEHLRKFFPERCDSIRRQQLLTIIEREIAHALEHGLEREVDIMVFVNICFGEPVREPMVAAMRRYLSIPRRCSKAGCALTTCP